ncbi:MAG: type II secretion system F family protein [Gaiellales bacterium]
MTRARRRRAAIVVLTSLVAGACGAAISGVPTGLVVVSGASAAMVTWQWRSSRALDRDRRRALMAELPDVIDVLAAVVDGGAAPDAALRRIAELATEPLRGALLDAGDCGLDGSLGARLASADPALRPLGALLRQNEELGVPIAAALRLVAVDARARARAAAREQAAQAAPKMLLVVGVLLAPASLLIVIGGQVLVLRDVVGTVLQ